ncbi:hypothetical protein [Heliorestis convoluta]|uniref:Uncharacterized protein n=1 Tax=Heliorestis convoluta TaxID=356322 RepID=A0A5Q2N0F4_9FIRM|nr:hypothetical protein [Heliorestis convoluta]QGG47781.1 hypothetical protein FTV88_1682 [Heliorestis convoluta]
MLSLVIGAIYLSIPLDRIEAIPRQERQEIVIWPEKKPLGWTERQWVPGESFIDPQGRPWKVTSTSKGEVVVWSDPNLLSCTSDPVLSQEGFPFSFHLSFENKLGTIVLIYDQREALQASYWQEALGEQGYQVEMVAHEAARRGQIRKAKEAGPLAILRLQESDLWNWQDEEGKDRVIFLLDRHPRMDSNLSFLLRWQEEIPEHLRAVIIFCRQSYGQHFFPRSVDIMVPSRLSKQDIEVLSTSLISALNPFLDE